MVKRRGPPSQGWRTFLRNHAPDIAAMDLFVVPTIGFELLYAFVIVRLDRRDMVWINVTANPTAEWVARQITEAFPWDEAPKYLIRDRDQIYGAVGTRRLRAMGIRDKPTAPASPWQNGFAERLIDPARVCGPHHCLGRGASAPNSAILCRLLQRRQNAFLTPWAWISCLVLLIPVYAFFLSRRFSRVRSATTSFTAVASRCQ